MNGKFLKKKKVIKKARHTDALDLMSKGFAQSKVTLRTLKMAVTPKSREGGFKGKLLDFIKKKQEEISLGTFISDWKAFLIHAKEQFLQRIYMLDANRANNKDFQYLKVLGSGAYGDVLMALKKENGQFYAIKIMNKMQLVKKKHVSYAKSEKNVLNSIRFPFTIHLEFFFQTPKNVYLVLPLVLGKDLFMHLREVKKLNEVSAKFYLGQVTLALEYLHHLGLIYRDLKPENTLIDIDGYLKITDFGLCKLLSNGRTYTVCGTPEYIAPEVINSNGYGDSADWWSFGVLAYELCTGFTPFYSRDTSRLYIKITRGHYTVPSGFSHHFKDFLSHLITTDLTRRYGYTRHGVSSVKGHKWFSGIDWTALLNHLLVAPYKPGVCSQVENLKEYDDIQELSDTVFMDKYQHLFKEF